MPFLAPEIYLIDGENLVARFQAMKAEGRVPRPDVVHIPDVLVWVPSLIGLVIGDIRRVSYYTSAVGDDDYLAGIEKQIRSFSYEARNEALKKLQYVYPRVFKKPSKTTKTRSVDINIVIDALRYAQRGAVGVVCLISGDGDFVPLAQELIHAGVEVHLMALSSGLSQKLEASADMFTSLDDKFFEPVG